MDFPVPCGDFHHWGTSTWLVYLMENPHLEWMMTRGTPISGNLHVFSFFAIGFFIWMVRHELHIAEKNVCVCVFVFAEPENGW